MNFPIERARSVKPITLLTILGVLLLPAAFGGILVAALQNPTEHLDSMTAAIVNLDEPVTIDGRITPLGRQLAAGLVEGSAAGLVEGSAAAPAEGVSAAPTEGSNLSWVISNKEDAAAGLKDGSYQAVITIPAGFSRAATSSGQAIAGRGGTAEKATISVSTPKDGLVADDLITNQIAEVAAATLGTKVSEATMQNVLVSFTTIGDQIGKAASGASKLASGARDAATGAGSLADGATKLASGASALSSGAGSLASGLDTIAGKTKDTAVGAGQIGAGLASGAAALTDPTSEFGKLVGAAATGGSFLAAAATETTQVKTALDELVATCAASGASAAYCDQVSATAGLGATAATSAGKASAYLGPVSAGLPAAASGLSASMSQAGAGATRLASGLSQLATAGIAQSAAGARTLSAGALQVAEGATSLATGASSLDSGVDTLANGTTDLAGGLRTASDSLPSFSEKESTSLAAVIADPVSTDAAANTIFGPTAIPLLAAVVLWFGSLASFLVMRAHTARTLTSRRSSTALALRAFAPAALIGAGQGVLVALIVHVVADYDAAAWWAFAGTAVLIGIVFAAVNQALVSVLGGIGHWISALAGVLAVATGLISTVPAWLAGLGAALPTAPAFAGLISTNGAALASLIVWGVLSLAATTLAVARRRTTSVQAVLAGAS